MRGAIPLLGANYFTPLKSLHFSVPNWLGVLGRHPARHAPPGVRRRMAMSAIKQQRSPFAHPWRVLRLGVQERRPRTQSPCPRTGCVQRADHDASRGTCGCWARVPAGRPGGNSYSKRSARACSRGLVPASSRLSPVLPEPSPTLAGVCPAGRCTALQEFIKRFSGGLP